MLHQTPPRRREVSLVALLGVTLLAAPTACLMDQEVPVAAQIRCTSDEDCPATHLCKPALERCVPRAGRDEQPPAIETVWELAPSTGTAGTLFRLGFSVDEALGADPAVACTALSGAELRWSLDDAATERAARRYGFVYLARGSEGDGPCALAVDLVDAAGNAVVGVAAGSVSFDFTAPRLAGPVQVDPPRAASGAVVHVLVGFSEVLASTPTLWLVPDAASAPALALVEDTQLDATSFGFARTLRGDEAEGRYRVRVQASDPAGNALDQRSDGSLFLDFTPPALLGADFEAAVVRLGATITLVVEADEELGAPAGLAWAAGVDPGLAVLSQDGARSIFTLQVDATTPEGAFALSAVELVDAVGNRAWWPASAEVTVDRTPPRFDRLEVRPARASLQPGFDALSVEVELDESVAALQVELGARPAACLAQDAEARRHRCLYAVTGADAEGAQTLRAVATDAAGNQAFASRGVELDFTPPTVVAGTVSLQLRPAADNPLREVQRATLGTRVQLGFAVSEELASPPRVHLEGADGIAFATLASSSVFYLYELSVDAAVDEGAHGVVAELVDAVGNPAAVTLGLPVPLVVDRSPPLVDTAGLQLTRTPWGSAASAGEPALHLEGRLGLDPGETGGLLVVHDAAAAPRLELGRHVVEPSGTIAHLALNPADRVEVFVEYLDPAGNASAAHRVAAGSWVATLGRKLAGDLGANPHVARTRRQFSAPLLASGRAGSGVHEVSGADLALPDGAAVSVRGAAGTWRRIEATYTLGRLTGYHVVDDPGRGPLLLAGWAPGQPGVFWEWNGHRWLLLQIADPERDGSPPVTGEDRLVYDGRSNRVLLLRPAANLAGMDTWAWDGVSWARLSSDVQPEPARADFAVAYVGTLGGVLLFGGRRAGGGLQQDLWLWQDAGWQRLLLPPGSAVPAARAGAAMVYDPVTLALVLHGGCRAACGTSPALLDDTWVFDGVSWTLRHVDGPGPEVWHHQMIALPGGNVLLYGGERETAPGQLEPNLDAWLFDGSTWLGPFAGPPSSVPDAPRRVVFHSSMNEGLAVVDHALWTLGPAGWIERASLPQDPEADGEPDLTRTAIGVAYDAAAGLVVLHEGPDEAKTLPAATWSYDGRSWARRGEGLTETIAVQLVQRRESGRIYLLQGRKLYALDGWGWNAVGLPLTAAGGQALADDLDRGGLVLMGGLHEPEPGRLQLSAMTWTGSEAAWDEHELAASVEPRQRHALGWGGQGVMLYGGVGEIDGRQTFLEDMWRWDGQAWAKVAPADPWPGIRFDHALVWDANHQRLLLVGGAGERLWSWDGDAWEALDGRTIDLFGDGAPATYSKGEIAKAAYDVARDRLVLIKDGSDLESGVWEWQWLVSGTPGHSVEIDLGAARLPADTEWLGIDVDAVATGHGGDGQPAAVALLTWIDGQWSLCTRAGPGETIRWTASPGLSWYLSRPGRLHLGLRPEASNGATGAQLAVDYVEVRVRYRLP